MNQKLISSTIKLRLLAEKDKNSED